MRERENLLRRYTAIAAGVGTILLLASVVMLVPLVLLLAFPDELRHAMSFVLPAGLLALLGASLRFGLRAPADVTLTLQEGGVIVVAAWTVVMLVSAWPYARILDLSFPLALFEAVSGWTTTGLTVVDVADADRIVLLWRSLTQLAGGAGLAILMMSAIVGPTGAGVSSAEGRAEQLVPQVRRSARLMLSLYVGYAALGTAAYVAVGMPAFDAVNHAFAAVATGGFSTHPASIGHWDSLAIEAVSLPLMVLGSLSFVTAWALIRGRWRVVWRNSELRLVAVLFPLAAALVFLLTSRTLYPSLSEGLRAAVFETVTALTGTGFTTASYAEWNAFGLLLLMFLMVIGGGTCSTSGGMKQLRVMILITHVRAELRRSLLPRTTVVEDWLVGGERRIYLDDARIRHTSAFVLLFLAAWALGALILTGGGFSLQQASFEMASALGTVGLSVGVTDPAMPATTLWTLMAGMILGRLEFVVVIVSVMKVFVDGRKLLSRHP